MWYAGYDGTGQGRIGYATSSDGTTWNKYPGNPVLDVGPPGSWDGEMLTSSAVLLENGKLKMWYTGYDGSSNVRSSQIGYATAP